MIQLIVCHPNYTAQMSCDLFCQNEKLSDGSKCCPFDLVPLAASVPMTLIWGMDLMNIWFFFFGQLLGIGLRFAKKMKVEFLSATILKKKLEIHLKMNYIKNAYQSFKCLQTLEYFFFQERKKSMIFRNIYALIIMNFR